MSIGWVAVGAAAVGTVYSANKASKAQNNATAAASDVASQEIALSRETLDWYKQMYQEQKPMVERAAATADQVSQAQLESMRMNDRISQDYWDYQKNTFRPLEQKIVDEAQAYNTPQRQEAEAAKAVAEAESQLGNETAQMQRQMARSGRNPFSGAGDALATQRSLAEAAIKAGVANKARNDTELQGYARMADAANLGRNLASSQATSAGIALNAGNNAVGNAQVPVNMTTNAANMVGQGYSTALQGMGSASNSFSKIAGMQQGAGNIWGGIGNIAGQFAGSQAGSQWITGMLPKIGA